MTVDFEVVVEGCIASISSLSQIKKERQYFTGITR
jgi:hypothetical protein